MAPSKGWPTGLEGTGRIISSERVYGENIIAATNAEIPFGTDIMQEQQPNNKKTKD